MDTTEIARTAMTCNRCFEGGALRRAGIGMAQPYTIGRDFWTQNRRVVLVGLNPGAAKDGAYKERRREVLERFRAGDDSAYERDYALAAESDVPLWANGKFLARVERLGLMLPVIAFGNIALCATEGNRYPSGMLKQCYGLHSRVVLAALKPDLIVLMGSAVEEFAQQLQDELPQATVITALHFAHRKGHAAEQRECDRVRALLYPVDSPSLVGGPSSLVPPATPRACLNSSPRLQIGAAVPSTGARGSECPGDGRDTTHIVREHERGS